MKFVIQYLSRGATRPITLVKTTRMKIRKDESPIQFMKRVLGEDYISIQRSASRNAILVWNKSDNRKKDGTPYKERPAAWTRFVNQKIKDGWRVVQDQVFPSTAIISLTPSLDGWV